MWSQQNPVVGCCKQSNRPVSCEKADISLHTWGWYSCTSRALVFELSLLNLSICISSLLMHYILPAGQWCLAEEEIPFFANCSATAGPQREGPTWMVAETKAAEMQAADLWAPLQQHPQYLPATGDHLVHNASAGHFPLCANILPMHLTNAHCATQMYYYFWQLKSDIQDCYKFYMQVNIHHKLFSLRKIKI